VLKNPSNAAVITDNVKLCAYAVAFWEIKCLHSSI
jgi:hypothetical protein